jgi:hypothetical protein
MTAGLVDEKISIGKLKFLEPGTGGQGLGICQISLAHGSQNQRSVFNT